MIYVEKTTYYKIIIFMPSIKTNHLDTNSLIEIKNPAKTKFLPNASFLYFLPSVFDSRPPLS